jgi:amidase
MEIVMSLNKHQATSTRTGAFFVPHDIKAPLKGASMGPLFGLTAAVKDMYDIAGERTGGGSPEWLAEQKLASKHAPAVSKILDAGATIIGKTICDEFFFSITGANAHYGTPENVRAPGRIPGGSSSGSAAATAAGCCDFALGSDTGGSVRIPASFCGLYGIRPTHGRVDLSGAMPMAPSFDVCGWFANGPGVLQKVGAVLLGSGGVKAAVTKVVIADDAFAEVDSEVAGLARRFLVRAEARLPKPSHEKVSLQGLEAWRETFRILQAFETWKSNGDFIERKKPNLGPGNKERLLFGATVTEEMTKASQKIRDQARERIEGLLKPGTVLAMPTSPSIAPLRDSVGKEQEAARLRIIRLTSISGLSGMPQLTMPMGTIQGCPVGFSFLGWKGGDEALLDLAISLSRYCGLTLDTAE